MDQAVLRIIYQYPGYGLALYVLITLLIAGTLSFLIGLERELRGEPAGLSTHILISISCSLLTTLSIWAIRFADHAYFAQNAAALEYDTSRIAAAVVSGIGFLGAGAIVKSGLTVRGLSTAATLWISAALGLACGAGFLAEAVIGTGVTMAVLFLTGRVKTVIDRRLPSLTAAVQGDAPIVAKLLRLADANSMVIRDISSGPVGEADAILEIHIRFVFQTPPVLILDMGRAALLEENVLYVEYHSEQLGKSGRICRKLRKSGSGAAEPAVSLSIGKDDSPADIPAQERADCIRLRRTADRRGCAS